MIKTDILHNEEYTTGKILYICKDYDDDEHISYRTKLPIETINIVDYVSAEVKLLKENLKDAHLEPLATSATLYYSSRLEYFAKRYRIS